MPVLKLKYLEEMLEQLDGFEKPKWLWEQYVTQPHIASRMLHYIESGFNDIEGKLVCDLGCGCGNLAIGASLLGAAHVIGFDIDPDALNILQSNAKDLDVNNIEVILSDVLSYLPKGFHSLFDTVIMNPPFGTSNTKGVDMGFLKVALALTKSSVYSLHKTTTREHVLMKATQLGAKAEVLAQLRFDLPATYKFHKKTSVDIEVDFIRFTIL